MGHISVESNNGNLWQFWGISLIFWVGNIMTRVFVGVLSLLINFWGGTQEDELRLWRIVGWRWLKRWWCFSCALFWKKIWVLFKVFVFVGTTTLSTKKNMHQRHFIANISFFLITSQTNCWKPSKPVGVPVSSMLQPSTQGLDAKPLRAATWHDSRGHVEA